MKRLFKHRPAVKLSLWLAMVIALSILVKINLVFHAEEKTAEMTRERINMLTNIFTLPSIRSRSVGSAESSDRISSREAIALGVSLRSAQANVTLPPTNLGKIGGGAMSIKPLSND